MSRADDLNLVLAGEHAAVWLLATVAGRTSTSESPTLAADLRSAHDLHRARRDQLVRMLRDLDAEPVAPEVAYDLPNRATTPAQCRKTALQVERRCTVLYSDLVSRTEETTRSWAINALVDSAVRQLAFGGTPAPLPGA